MKGIELAIQDDGQLAITCLEHKQTHIGARAFCCYDVMARAMFMAIQTTPEGYRARMYGMAKRPADITGLLFDIATTPLLSGLNLGEEDSPIRN